MNIHSIDTGFFKLDGGAMFGVVPKAIWNKLNPSDEKNLCTWAMRCLLVEEGDRLVLIDTGIGDKQGNDFFRHYYLHGEGGLEKSIRQAGYSPDEVTDVFLTHLHFDHVGGATRYDDRGERIIPRFKNAVYWSNKTHWDWAINPNPREKASFLKENLLPLSESGQLRFVGAQSPFSFMDILFVDGHTEKQMLPLIRYKNHQLLYLADLIPSTHHVKPPYVMSYDVRPLLTMEEKERVLQRAESENYILFFEHDPLVEAATLELKDGVRTLSIIASGDL